jgi:hypothetical protein
MPHVQPISLTITVPTNLCLSLPPTSTYKYSSVFFSLTQSTRVREDAELKSYNVMAYAVELGFPVTLKFQYFNFSVDFAYIIRLFCLHLGRFHPFYRPRRPLG